jgi:hypothetical protein
MIALLWFAAVIQASPQPPTLPSKEQVDAYVQSLADAPDAVAVSLDKDGQLRKIYAAYFACYRDSLDRDPRSDLRDSAATTSAFKSAYAACASLRENADEAAITYAAKDTDLKNADERRRAIEYYRGWRGEIMLRDYYQQRGKSAEFGRYLDQMRQGSERGQ